LTNQNEQRDIEMAFAESWNGITAFFVDLTQSPNWAWLNPILGLIAELRARGFD